MNEEDKKNSEDSVESLMFKGHLAVLLRVVPTTLSVIGVCAGIGYLVDREIGSHPVGLIIGLVVAFPILQYSIYKQTKALINNRTNKK